MVEQFYDGNIQLPDGSTIHEAIMKAEVEELEAKVEELEKELDKLKDELKNAKAKLEVATKGKDIDEGKRKDIDEGRSKDIYEGKGKDIYEGKSKDIYEGKSKVIYEGKGKDIDEGKNLFILIAGPPGSEKSSGLAKAMMNYEGGEYKEDPIKHVLFNFEGKNFVHLGSLRAQYPGSDSLPASQASANQGLPRHDGGQAACHCDRRTEAD